MQCCGLVEWLMLWAPMARLNVVVACGVTLYSKVLPLVLRVASTLRAIRLSVCAVAVVKTALFERCSQ